MQMMFKKIKSRIKLGLKKEKLFPKYTMHNIRIKNKF